MTHSNQASWSSIDVAREGIQEWLLTYISRLLGRPAAEIELGDSFERLGLDSSASVGLAGDLGEWLGLEFEPTITYDHSSITELTAFIVGDGEFQKICLSDSQIPI